MALQSVIPVEFLKAIISAGDGRLPSKLRLPIGFVEEFGNFVPRTVILKTMDGEEVRIRFSRVEGAFCGMQSLWTKLRAKKLQFLFLRYIGGPNFEAFLLDTNFVLKSIPRMDSPFQSMFMKVICTLSSRWRSFNLPEDFLSNFGHLIPGRICFHLSNGLLVEGCFNLEKGSITGLQSFYKLYNMSMFDLMVFTYVGPDVFVVRGFGKDCMPKICIDDLGGFFEIKIKPSHLQEYDFGVTVPAKFKAVVDDFGASAVLDIRHGYSRWEVVLKRRSSRVELHGGWCLIWKALKLEVGDICLFKRSGLSRKFYLEVYNYRL